MLGFLSLGILLFFSCLMSYLELGRLTHSTQGMLHTSRQNLEISKIMLDAVQDQNRALLEIMVAGQTSYDSLLRAGRARFDGAVRQARSSTRAVAALDTVIAANIRYNSLVDSRLAEGKSSDNVQWFVNVYGTSYYELTASVKTFMIASQQMMDTEARQVERNAYRAIMPGIIALVIAIVIIVTFFYLVDVYYIQPVLKITQGLHNYIHAKVPFNVSFEGRDEIFNLKEYIETLIDQLKNRKTE